MDTPGARHSDWVKAILSLCERCNQLEGADKAHAHITEAVAVSTQRLVLEHVLTARAHALRASMGLA